MQLKGAKKGERASREPEQQLVTVAHGPRSTNTRALPFVIWMIIQQTDTSANSCKPCAVIKGSLLSDIAEGGLQIVALTELQPIRTRSHQAASSSSHSQALQGKDPCREKWRRPLRVPTTIGAGTS